MERRIVIAGGSGFIGRATAEAFSDEGFEVVVLGRSKGAHGPFRNVCWDAKNLGDWAGELEGAHTLLNLTGEPISQKWTLDVQERILASRIESTAVLGKAVSSCERPPSVWINASAIGVYGNRGDHILDEAADVGDPGEFLVETAAKWEAAFGSAEAPRTRKVAVRIGIVLARHGGAFPTLLKLAKAYLGGNAGDGQQWMSWIHLKDLRRMMVWAALSEAPPVLNATTMNPVRNSEFMGALRSALKKPWSPPVPSFALMLASAFGAPDPTLILHGQRVLPVAALDRGFRFEFPTLEAALSDLLG